MGDKNHHEAWLAWVTHAVDKDCPYDEWWIERVETSRPAWRDRQGKNHPRS